MSPRRIICVEAEHRAEATDIGDTSMAAIARDSRGRFGPGCPTRFMPGRSGNPAGRVPGREGLVDAFRRHARASDVLDERRVLLALEALAVRFPLQYIRLVFWAFAETDPSERKIGKAKESVPKPKRRRRRRTPVL